MIISLARVDDRLIHGQVSLTWVKETKVGRIIVVSDEVAKDEIRKTLLKNVAPPGVNVSIVDIEKMGRVYKNPKYEKDRVMLLFTTPIDAERVLNLGVKFDHLNIGGIAFKQGRTQLSKAISVNQEEADSIRRMAEKGITFDTKKLTSDSSENLLALLNKYKM